MHKVSEKGSRREKGANQLADLVVLLVFTGLYLLNAHGGAAHLSWDEALYRRATSQQRQQHALTLSSAH
jgi:hypothetical protein